MTKDYLLRGAASSEEQAHRRTNQGGGLRDLEGWLHIIAQDEELPTCPPDRQVLTQNRQFRWASGVRSRISSVSIGWVMKDVGGYAPSSLLCATFLGAMTCSLQV